MSAQDIDLQRRADDLATILRGEGRQVEANLVLSLRSKVHELREKLDRIRTMTG